VIVQWAAEDREGKWSDSLRKCSAFTRRLPHCGHPRQRNLRPSLQGYWLFKSLVPWFLSNSQCCWKWNVAGKSGKKERLAKVAKYRWSGWKLNSQPFCCESSALTSPVVSRETRVYLDNSCCFAGITTGMFVHYSSSFENVQLALTAVRAMSWTT